MLNGTTSNAIAIPRMRVGKAGGDPDPEPVCGRPVTIAVDVADGKVAGTVGVRGGDAGVAVGAVEPSAANSRVWQGDCAPSVSRSA